MDILLLSFLSDIWTHYNDPMLGGVGAINLLVAALCIIVGLASALTIPGPFARFVTRALVSHRYTHRDDMRIPRGAKQLRSALSKFLFSTILLISFLLAVYVLFPSLDWSISLKVFEDRITLYSLVLTAFGLVLLYLFLALGLKPMARTGVSAILSGKVKFKVEMRFTKALVFWSRISIYHIMLLMVLRLLGNSIASTFPLFYIRNLFILTFIISFTMVFMTVLITILKVTSLSGDKVEPHAAYAIERVIKFLLVLFGCFIGLTAIGIDLMNLLTVFAFIGVALAFGIQDSIANLMSGIELAVDRPFAIGDRIRIGPEGSERWGDVVSIGLRSTSLITPEDEMVVFPNRLIASTEIWNYTKGSNIVADRIPVSISYGSDWRLAKKVIVEAADAHPYIMKTPQPHVRMNSFADSGIQLEVWYWIPDVRDKYQIRSDILEMIKDQFDTHGVEIPFPYRTVVYKSDLPAEAHMDPGKPFRNARRYPSRGKDHFETRDLARRLRAPTGGSGGAEAAFTDSVDPGNVSTLLVAARNTATAGMLAEFSIKIGHKLSADVVVLFVMERRTIQNEKEAIEVLDIFDRVGKAYGVKVGTLLEHGDPLTEIINITESRKIDVVIMGESRKEGLDKWFTADYASTIIQRTGIPVITMPYRKELMGPHEVKGFHANM